VAAWVILFAAGVYAAARFLLACIEHDRQSKTDSEYYWQIWEKEVKTVETHRFLHSQRAIDRRIYPRYAEDVSEVW
jgi:hypothetical protein